MCLISKRLLLPGPKINTGRRQFLCTARCDCSIRRAAVVHTVLLPKLAPLHTRHVVLVKWTTQQNIDVVKISLQSMWRSLQAAGVLSALLANHRLSSAEPTYATGPPQITATGASAAAPSAAEGNAISDVPVNSSSARTSNNSLQASTPGKQQQWSHDQQNVSSKQRTTYKEGVHFAVLTGSGSAAKLTDIVKAMQQTDVAILGEYHDDPVAHAMQLELLQRTAKGLGYHIPAATTPASVAPAAVRHPTADLPVRHNDGSKAAAAAAAAVTEQHLNICQAASQQPEPALQRQSTPVPSRPLILSLEMFERDVQPVLDEYLAGSATLSDLLRDARPWPNYRTDYHPMVQFCRSLAALYNNSSNAAHSSCSIDATTASSGNDLNSGHSSISSSARVLPGACLVQLQPFVKVVASNAPRRYVSLAGRSGQGALRRLPAASQAYLAPLPYAQPSQAYIDKVQSSMTQAAVEMQRHRERARRQAEAPADKAACPEQQPNDDGMSHSSKQHTPPQPPAAVDAEMKGADVPGAAAAAVEQPGRDGGACPYIGFNVSSKFLDAQCLWDATMAFSISQQLRQQQPGLGSQHHEAGVHIAAHADAAQHIASAQPVVIHICGKFHAESWLGIPEHLKKQYAPSARVLVVVFVPHTCMEVSEPEFKELGLQGLADFVVLTDSSMPRSFASVHPV